MITLTITDSTSPDAPPEVITTSGALLAYWTADGPAFLARGQVPIKARALKMLEMLIMQFMVKWR